MASDRSLSFSHCVISFTYQDEQFSVPSRLIYSISYLEQAIYTFHQGLHVPYVDVGEIDPDGLISKTLGFEFSPRNMHRLIDWAYDRNTRRLLKDSHELQALTVAQWLKVAEFLIVPDLDTELRLMVQLQSTTLPSEWQQRKLMRKAEMAEFNLTKARVELVGGKVGEVCSACVGILFFFFLFIALIFGLLWHSEHAREQHSHQVILREILDRAKFKEDIRSLLDLYDQFVHKKSPFLDKLRNEWTRILVPPALPQKPNLSEKVPYTPQETRQALIDCLADVLNIFFMTLYHTIEAVGNVLMNVDKPFVMK